MGTLFALGKDIVGSQFEPYDSGDSVSVTADGVKTYATLLNELYALVDKDRIGRNSILIWNESNQNFIYHTGQNAPSGATYFERATVNGSNWQIISIRLQGASKVYMNVSGSISDVSSSVASSGITITLYYESVLKVQEVEEIPSDSVSVTADGVKTYAQLLGSLYTLTNFSKLTIQSMIEETGATYQKYYYLTAIAGPEAIFARNTVSTLLVFNEIVSVKSSGAYYRADGSTISDKTDTVPETGVKLTLYYHATTRVIESCDAEDVSYGNSNVKDALDGLNSDKLRYVDVSIAGLAVTTENSQSGFYYGVKDLTDVIPEDCSIVSASPQGNFDCYMLLPNHRRLLVCGTKSITISSSLQRDVRVWYKKV